MNREKLSQRTWFTILLIFVFFPVGLFLMWKNKKFSKIVRIIVTALFAILIICNMGDNFDSQVNKSSQVVSSDVLQDVTAEESDLSNQVEDDKKNSNQSPVVEKAIKDETVSDDIIKTTSTSVPTFAPSETVTVKSDIYDYNGVSYKIISVDGGDLSGDREPNVAVNIGYGDREYWALTNEYGQLVKVVADKIIIQDELTEPVNSKGRYYSDEAKVKGTEQKDLDEGHVIADSLGGVSNAYNITPQNKTLNRYGDQAYMEKVIRDAGGCEDLVAIITYPDTKTQIPSHYYYEYVLRGEKIVDDFDNANPDKVNESLSEQILANSKTTKETNTNPTEEKHDLSAVDTNGNGKVTIAEAKAAGYSMPIYSNQWLYQYMDDRDGDGMVGE